MIHERYFSVEDMWSASWGRQLALDLTREVENFAGEKGYTAPEVRKFFAIKGYRDLLNRLKRARDGRTGFAALRSVSNEMRQYALDRPALWAAASRTPTSDCSEWRTGHKDICDFLLSIFAECGINGRDAEDALYMLRSLVRGFALHQILGSFLYVYSHDESFDWTIDVFIAGLQALKTRRTSRGHSWDEVTSVAGSVEKDVENGINSVISNLGGGDKSCGGQNLSEPTTQSQGGHEDSDLKRLLQRTRGQHALSIHYEPPPLVYTDQPIRR